MRRGEGSNSWSSYTEMGWAPPEPRGRSQSRAGSFMLGTLITLLLLLLLMLLLLLSLL